MKVAVMDKEPEAKILPADQTLKKKLGGNVDLSLLVNRDTLAKAEQQLLRHRSTFIELIREQFRGLKSVFENAQHTPNSAALMTIASLSFSIKSEAGTFGYVLASNIARSLYNYCESVGAFDEDAQVVIKSHIDALNVVFQQDIGGDGGDIGKEVLENLRLLVQQFSA